MPPAPIPEHEVNRLEALLCCNVLDTAPEPAFDDLTRLASRLCETPISLVSLVDEHRQWFKSRVGLAAEQTPRDQAICAYAILAPEPLIIPDTTNDDRTKDNPLVTGEPGLRFYAGVPLRLPDGHAVGTLCVIDYQPRELTDRMMQDLLALARQAESQLELRAKIDELGWAKKKLERESQSKSMFLANMSHEIRTPMTAILGYADLLDGSTAAGREVLNDPQWLSHALTSVRNNANHLMAIINDILDMSKIEAGQMKVDPADVDLPAIVHEVEEIQRPAAEAKLIELRVTFASPVPRTVRSDAVRLRQILLNLIGNAIKFTSQGRVELAIAYDQPDDRLAFTVTDTGIGMTEEHLETVRRCDAFSQADASTTRKFGGTGLGLSISNSLAKALGGPGLDIRSEYGVGSTFAFTIPAGTDAIAAPAAELVSGEDAEAEPAPTPKAPTPEANPKKPLQGRRILLAEDGPDNQKLIEFHLKRAGARVSIVANGRDAFHTAVDSELGDPFDVVLMDMQMPEIDGYEAARMLRQSGFSTPIIALTAHAMTGDREKCLAAGCCDYCTKPIDVDTLINTCLHWIGLGARHAV